MSLRASNADIGISFRNIYSALINNLTKNISIFISVRVTLHQYFNRLILKLKSMLISRSFDLK